MTLAGAVIPAAEVQIYVAGAKLTVGRAAVVLLLLPALLKLFGSGRRLLLADFLILATAVWMIGAAFYVSGASALSSAGAEALELFGGYIVARAYFFGAEALKSFVGALAVIAVIAIFCGLADRLAHRLVVHDLFGSLMHVRPIDAQDRMGVLRAASTFDHAILFGLFCAVAATIFVYAAANPARRLVYVGICFVGGFLSLSSSSLMAFGMMFGVYGYDTLLRGFSWRWNVCWAALAALAIAIGLLTQNPLGWVLSHLTLDPASGYFRLLEWTAAIDQISLAPWAGYAFREFGTAELYSVDSVWLAFALRFGLPMIALLLLTNFAVLAPFGTRRIVDPYLTRMRMAFSVVLVVYMFVGLTAHFWNYMWIFWGTCLGIAASLREQSLIPKRRSAAAGMRR